MESLHDVIQLFVKILLNNCPERFLGLNYRRSALGQTLRLSKVYCLNSFLILNRFPDSNLLRHAHLRRNNMFGTRCVEQEICHTLWNHVTYLSSSFNTTNPKKRSFHCWREINSTNTSINADGSLVYIMFYTFTPLIKGYESWALASPWSSIMAWKQLGLLLGFSLIGFAMGVSIREAIAKADEELAAEKRSMKSLHNPENRASRKGKKWTRE